MLLSKEGWHGRPFARAALCMPRCHHLHLFPSLARRAEVDMPVNARPAATAARRRPHISPAPAGPAGCWSAGWALEGGRRLGLVVACPLARLEGRTVVVACKDDGPRCRGDELVFGPGEAREAQHLTARGRKEAQGSARKRRVRPARRARTNPAPPGRARGRAAVKTCPAVCLAVVSSGERGHLVDVAPAEGALGRGVAVCRGVEGRCAAGL